MGPGPWVSPKVPGSGPTFRICRILDTYILSSLASILDTCFFFQIISIYHSESHDRSQVYVMSLHVSYYEILEYTQNLVYIDLIAFTESQLWIWNKIETHMSRVSARYLQTFHAAAYNSQNAIFGTCNWRIARLTPQRLSPLPGSQLAGWHFWFTQNKRRK